MNNSNQLTSVSASPNTTFTYDNNGNTATKVNTSGTTTYTWDSQNQLTQVSLPGGVTVTFKYDPFGRRTQKVSSAGTTTYIYDGASVIEELDSAGLVIAKYAQGRGTDEPLATLRGSTSFYHADGLGSITSLTDTSGALTNTYAYDSFGKVSASTGTVTNAIRYTGREFDNETGLYFYRARYFDPNPGRFLSGDPTQFGGGINFYAYTLNNPINLVDPGGLKVYPVNFIGPLLPGDVRGPGYMADLTSPLLFPLQYPPYDPASRFYGESQECVAFTKKFTDLPCTDCWRAGPRVVGNDIPRGTAIATFDENGRYPEGVHQNSGIYVGPGHLPNSIEMIDQWPGHPAQDRTVYTRPHAYPANNAAAYSVITVPFGTTSTKCKCGNW